MHLLCFKRNINKKILRKEVSDENRFSSFVPMVMYGPKKNAKVLSEWGGGSPRRKKEKKREKREKSGEKRRFQNPPKKTHEGKKANSLFVWSVGIVKLSCKPKRIIITPDNSEIGALRITNKQTI